LDSKVKSLTSGWSWRNICENS